MSLSLLCTVSHAQVEDLSKQEKELIFSIDSTILQSEYSASKQILKQVGYGFNISEVGQQQLNFRDSLVFQFEAFDQSNDIEVLESSFDRFLDNLKVDSIQSKYIKFFITSVLSPGDYNNLAIQYYDRLIELAKRTSPLDSMYVAELLVDQSNKLSSTGQVLRSKQAKKEALNYCLNYSEFDYNFVGIIYYELHQILWKQNNYAEATKYIDLAELTIAKNKDPIPGLIREIYREKANIAILNGYYDDGEQFTNLAWEMFRKDDGSFDFKQQDFEVSYHYDKMRIYLSSRNIEKAKEVYNYVENLYAAKKLSKVESRMFAEICNLMGEIYLVDDPAKAVPYFAKSVYIHHANGELENELKSKFNLTKAQLYSENFLKTKELAFELIEVGEAIHDFRLPFFYAMAANVWMGLDNLDSSSFYLNRVLEAFNPNTPNIKLGEGNWEDYPLQNNLAGAIMLSKMAIRLKEFFPGEERANDISYELNRIAIAQFNFAFNGYYLSGNLERHYENMVNGIIKSHLSNSTLNLPTKEIISFSDKIHARYLWEKFKANNKNIYQQSDSIQIAEQQLRSELIALQKDLKNQSNETTNTKIFEVENQLKLVEKEKRRSNNTYYEFESYAFDLSEFQSDLGLGTTVLKYEHIADQLYLFVIKTDTIILQVIGDYQLIETATLEMLKLIQDPQSDVLEIQNLGGELYQKLIPESLSEIEQIYILPDGILNYLPFEILVHENQYWFERQNLSYIVGLSFLSSQNEEVHPVQNACFFAPTYTEYLQDNQTTAMRGSSYNLQGALAEVKAINSFIVGTSYAEEQGTKEKFLKNVSNYDLIHLSMHSYINDDVPQLNSLVFYDQDLDHELYLSELYGMKLKAKLAVLSACNTGIGAEKSGEGMVSMNRAFTYAGVPSVVSSLWGAPDLATREVMVAFYEGLTDGKNKSEALAEAKRNYFKKHQGKITAHPFYFAGFVLHGDINALEIRQNSPMSLYIILGIAAGILIIITLLFKRFHRE